MSYSEVNDLAKAMKALDGKNVILQACIRKNLIQFYLPFTHRTTLACFVCQDTVAAYFPAGACALLLKAR